MTTTSTALVESGEAGQPIALGYVRAHILMTETELADAQSELANYAEREGYTLGRVFVEQPDTVPNAFRALIDQIRREEPQAILTPNALHLAVLGLPPRIMHIIHATTGVPVLLANLPGPATQANGS